jgi:O-antigen/teichoic acid export membrane protein
MIKRNIIANWIGQGVSALMGLAFVPLYIRYLGMEAYGLIGIFVLLQAWLSILDMGITPTLNREMARFTAGAHTPQSIHNLLRSLELICFFIAVLITGGLLASSNWLATEWIKVGQLSTELVSEAISIMAVIVSLRFIEGIYRGSLFGLHQQIWYNSVYAISNTLRYGGVVAILAWVSPTIGAFFLWQGLISMLTLVVYGTRVHRKLPNPLSRPQFSRKAIAEVWMFAGGMAGITLLGLMLTQVDKVLLSRLLTLEMFGFYALATAVAGILPMVTGPVAQAVYPRMIELLTQGGQSELILIYHKAAQLVTVLTAPIMLLLVCFSGGVIFMWSGDANLAEKTSSVLSILIVGTFLNSLMIIPYMLQIAHGWTSLAIKTNIVAVTLLIPAIFWVTPIYGAVGAAWIWAILNTGYVFIAIQFMHRRIIRDEKWHWYYDDLLQPIAGALVVMIIAWHIQPESYLDRTSWFFFLLFTGSFAIASSALMAKTIRNRIKLYLRSF